MFTFVTCFYLWFTYTVVIVKKMYMTMLYKYWKWMSYNMNDEGLKLMWSSWSYCSWIYNYVWNQYLSPLKLWVRINIIARYTVLDTIFCDKVCQWLVTGFLRILWFPPPIKLTHNIAEHFLNVALNTIILMPPNL